MKVAVVLLNYNGKALLQAFLPGVCQHTPDADIVLIDNASTDDSVEYVQRDFPNVLLVKLDKNYGFAQGYNIGLQQVFADIYVLLNTDVEVSENWLQPCISMLSENNNIAAVQPKILSQRARAYFEYAGASGGFIDFLGYTFCRGRIFDTIEPDNHQYDTEQEIHWASGACLCIRADLFHTFHGFDSQFFAHMEEIDLCWRLRRAGHSIYVQPSATVFHVGGASLSKQNAHKTFLNFRNNLLMCVKNFSTSKLFWFIPLRLVLDGIAALMLWKNVGFAHLWAVLRAHFSFYMLFTKTLRERAFQNNLIQQKKETSLYKKSVLIDYFIFKKRKYSEMINCQA